MTIRRSAMRQSAPSRNLQKALGLLLMFLLVPLAISCDGLPGKPDISDMPPDPRTLVDPVVLYSENCSGCHGADGTHGAARSMNDPLYLAFVGRERFAEIVDRGVPGSLMPGFGSTQLLSAAQQKAVVNGIYDRWGGSPEGVELPPYSVPALSGDALEASVKRGAEVFATHCTSCHEDASQVTNPTYLALVSDQALRSTVVCGRTDLGKPDWRGLDPSQSLSFMQITDVTNWLASHRTEFPGQSYDQSAQKRILEDD
ncbi:MAG: c-type cytochrome [Planctomycetota bacterium]|jgi:mono/diheme cytochrome c family protein|nr:c-type cytochrome [Planctomycetota bacterium]